MDKITPEEAALISASTAEFLKLCHRHGLNTEQVIQVAVTAAASGIVEEAQGDVTYALELVARAEKSINSAVVVSIEEENGTESTVLKKRRSWFGVIFLALLVAIYIMAIVGIPLALRALDNTPN